MKIRRSAQCHTTVGICVDSPCMEEKPIRGLPSTCTSMYLYAYTWIPLRGHSLHIHVNLDGMSVSFTDFHPFKLLTGVHLKSYGL